MAIRRTRFYAGYVFAVLALLIFLHYLGPLRPLENWLRALFFPASRQLYNLSVQVGDSWRFFKDRQEFIDSYRNCAVASANYEQLQAKSKLLEDENAELKKQLGYIRVKNFRTITGSVVARNTDDVEKLIFIDRGGNDGVKLGQAVIAGDGILVGKVVKVDNGTAAVELMSDNQSKVAATVVNKDHSLGVVEGGYGLSLRMKYIPRNEVVVVGDLVVTSGLEEGMAKGLLIGSVAVVENEAYKPFQQAVISPALDLSKLTLVSVVVAE